MSYSSEISQTLEDKVNGIILRAVQFERPVQHEFVQQELYNFFWENGYKSYFEFDVSYQHNYRGKKNVGKSKLIKYGRIDIYAIKEDLKIAIEPKCLQKR